MEKITYTINFDVCYETEPCQHSVIVTKNNISTEILLHGDQILDLIIDNDINVSYDDLCHFECDIQNEKHRNLFNILKLKQSK